MFGDALTDEERDSSDLGVVRGGGVESVTYFGKSFAERISVGVRPVGFLNSYNVVFCYQMVKSYVYCFASLFRHTFRG